MRDRIRGWTISRVAGYRPPHPGRAIRHDALAFFPELGLVFNRVKKAGNTSVVLTLNDIAGGPAHGGTREAKAARSWGQVPFHDLLGARNWHWLAVVRNPGSRILSGFLEKVGGGRPGVFEGYAGFGRPDPDGFHDFLDDLAGRDLVRTDGHFWPQTALLVRPAERFDHLARLETLSRDMAPVLAALGRDPAEANRFAKPHSQELANPGKITSPRDPAAFLTPSAMEIVAHLYAADYAQLGYPSGPDARALRK